MNSQFTIGSVIGEALRVWVKKLPMFTALAGVCYLPYLALLFLGAQSAESQEPSAAVGLVALLFAPLFVLLTGMVTYGTVQHVRGLHAPLSKTFSVALGRLLPLLGVSFLVSLAVFVGSLLLIIPGFMVFLAFYVAAPVAIVERRGVVGTLERSNELTLGHKWSILGLVLVASLISTAITFSGALIIGLFGTMAPIAAMILMFTLQGAMMTFSCVLPAVTYYRLRQEKEGTTIDELAAVFE